MKTTHLSPDQLTILEPYRVKRKGVTITLGRCPVCGRKLRPSAANNTGARCHYDGAQFDRNGKLLNP